MKPIPFLTPRLPDPALVALDYQEIFAAGVFTNSGPFEDRFAAELARWIGGDVAVSVTANATVSLQLACKTLFHADRPLVPVASFTAAAVPLAVTWSGFTPILLDIEPDSWQPDIRQAEALLARAGDEVAGILLTNTFGTPNATIAEWEALARRFGVALVIDSAPGFASAYEWGEPLGARGDCEVFSFHATKTVAIGEGGAIASRDPEFIARIDQLKNFGFDDDRRSLGRGLNGKLAEFASALGVRQLEVLADRLARRRQVLDWYLSGLKPLGCEFQTGVSLAAPPFVSIALGSQSQRDQVGSALDQAEVGWRAYYNPPIHCQPSFAGVQTAGDLAVTEDVSRRIISLPLDEQLSSCEVDRVVDVVRDVVG
jgi:dTDP-4-amino-4,6-dideoxygalactose transaminase